MKYNSYVATGYKHGIIRNPNRTIPAIRNVLTKMVGSTQESDHKKEDMEMNASIYKEMIIPFEEVDGLSLQELKAYPNLLYQDRYLIFIMYDSIASREQNGDLIIEFGDWIEEAVARYIYMIDTEKNKECSIDEIVEEHLVATLDQLRTENRRRSLDFLEKYVGGTRTEVNSRINHYLNNNFPSKSIYKYIKIPERLINQKPKS